MTAARKQFLRDQLEQARASALGAAYDFNDLCQDYKANPRKIDDAARRVILAAAEVRIAARALTVRRAA